MYLSLFEKITKNNAMKFAFSFIIIISIKSTSVAQQTDLKVVLRNQIKFFQIEQTRQEQGLFNKAVTAFQEIKQAEEYLTKNNVPIFKDDDELRLYNAVFSAGKAARETKQLYIQKLQQELIQIEQQEKLPNGQVLDNNTKAQINNLIDALKAHQSIQEQFNQVQENNKVIEQRLKQELQNQIFFEQIQQQTQPLTQQQQQTIQSTIQNLQQYQQQIVQQQLPQVQAQIQIQQQTQALSPQQQQMIQQLINALQQQQSQIQQQQTQVQGQMFSFSRLNN